MINFSIATQVAQQIGCQVADLDMSKVEQYLNAATTTAADIALITGLHPEIATMHNEITNGVTALTAISFETSAPVAPQTPQAPAAPQAPVSATGNRVLTFAAAPCLPKIETKVGKLLSSTPVSKDGFVQFIRLEIQFPESAVPVQMDVQPAWLSILTEQNPSLKQTAVSCGKYRKNDQTPATDVLAPKPGTIINIQIQRNIAGATTYFTTRTEDVQAAGQMAVNVRGKMGAYIIHAVDGETLVGILPTLPAEAEFDRLAKRYESNRLRQVDVVGEAQAKAEAEKVGLIARSEQMEIQRQQIGFASALLKAQIAEAKELATEANDLANWATVYLPLVQAMMK